MSVLRCSRYGCENIMCERHSHRHGYLCEECFGELVSLGTATNIAGFLETPKSDRVEPSKEDPRQYFSRVFPTMSDE